jgi:hypothetical protein
VAFITAAIVAPAGDCSIAMTRACFERASVLLVFGASADCWEGFAALTDIGDFAGFLADFDIEILHSVYDGVAPHHRSPASAIKPAGQDLGAPLAPQIGQQYRSNRGRMPVLSEGRYDPHPATLDRRIRESGETFPKIQSAIYRDNAASKLRLIIVWLEVRSLAQTEIFRLVANSPELAGIRLRISPLQAVDWISRTIRRLCLCLAKSRFPTVETSIGGDSVRMLGQWGGKPSSNFQTATAPLR